LSLSGLDSGTSEPLQFATLFSSAAVMPGVDGSWKTR
jgi:hypothetical protein